MRSEHLVVVVGVRQHPGQLHQRRLGQHVVQRHDADLHQVAARVVDVHLGVAPERLHRHDDVHALLDRLLHVGPNMQICTSAMSP